MWRNCHQGSSEPQSGKDTMIPQVMGTVTRGAKTTKRNGHRGLSSSAAALIIPDDQ